MPFAAARLYRWLGRHYLWLYVGFEITTALIIGIATLGLFALYTPGITHAEFWRLAIVAETLVSLALVYTVAKAIKMAKPLADWLRTRDPDGAHDAWLVAIEIPRGLVFVNGWKPFAIISAPGAVIYTLELTLLITKSLVGPVNELVEATQRVRGGDLDARVPVMSGDEIGALAGSFNEMMRGLSEREALRQAFGSYVDPDVAERVLEEGELLEGQEREVTVMFVDVRDFTP